MGIIKHHQYIIMRQDGVPRVRSVIYLPLIAEDWNYILYNRHLFGQEYESMICYILDRYPGMIKAFPGIYK